MTGDAWDTDLGRWVLAWRDYRRGNSPEIPDGSIDAADRCSATHTGYDGSVERCRERASHPNTDGWHMDEWGSGWRDTPESADEAFAREIALAHEVVDPKGLLPWLASLPESGDGTVGSDAKYRQMLAEEVCDDAIAADAATAFVPDVPLPFGGDVKE